MPISACERRAGSFPPSAADTSRCGGAAGRTPSSSSLVWSMIWRRRRKCTMPNGNSRPFIRFSTWFMSGKRHRARDRATAHLDEQHQLRIENRPEIGGQLPDLGVGRRHEAPVVVPGRAVDLLQNRQVAVEGARDPRSAPSGRAASATRAATRLTRTGAGADMSIAQASRSFTFR